MIVVTYTSPKNKTLYGIMLRRDAESGMIEVAFDQTDVLAFSIGWIHPLKQMGRVSLKSNVPVRWRHRALRLIESKNIEEARSIFSEEETARKQERIRKERVV
jgi:hypothetical protein